MQLINTLTYTCCVKVAPPFAVAIMKKLYVPNIGYKLVKLTTNYNDPSVNEICGVFSELDEANTTLCLITAQLLVSFDVKLSNVNEGIFTLS